MPYDIALKDLSSQSAATIRLATPALEVGAALAQVLPEIWGYLHRTGVTPVGPPFVRYHSFGGPAVEIEAGLPVAGPVAEWGRILNGELPGGLAAVTWHVGPYDTIKSAYDALQAWMESHGHHPNGAPWEVYWTDPGQVPNPAEWRTEVIWPIK